MPPDSPAAPESLSPAARDRVVERLKELFAQDELDLAAFESKLERTFAARTSHDLEALIATLPALPALASAANAPALAPTIISGIVSGHKRAITSTVPRQLRVQAMLGYVELDLTGAVFAAGLTTIDARAFLGYVEIRLPAGVRVENEGRSLFGYFSVDGPPPAVTAGAADERVVRIVGRALFGYAESSIAGD